MTSGGQGCVPSIPHRFSGHASRRLRWAFVLLCMHHPLLATLHALRKERCPPVALQRLSDLSHGVPIADSLARMPHLSKSSLAVHFLPWGCPCAPVQRLPLTHSTTPTPTSATPTTLARVWRHCPALNSVIFVLSLVGPPLPLCLAWQLEHPGLA